MVKKIKSQHYNCLGVEPCFNGMQIDSVLMSEIQQLGGLSKNQMLFIHFMVKRVIEFAKIGFVDETGISALDISERNVWGPCPKTCPMHKRKTCRCMRKVTFQEDYYLSIGRNFPKGTVIGAWKENPFPAVKYESCYNWIMNPDLYDAPRFVLDFINEKLKEALPQLNLWAKATELKLLTIYDLNVHPNSKHY